jgi:hypothetical protein
MIVTLPDTMKVTLPETITVALPDTMKVTLPENIHEALSEDNVQKLAKNLQGTMLFTLPDKLKVTLPETQTETMVVALPDTLKVTLPESLPESLPETLTVGLPDAMVVTPLDALPENLPDTLIVTLPDTLRVTLPVNNNMGLWEDVIMLSYFIFIPALLMAAILVFPAFPATMQTFRQVTMEYPSRTTVSNNNKAINKDATALNPLISTEGLNQLLKNCEGMIKGKGNAKYILAIFFVIGLAWAVYGATVHWNVGYTYMSDLWSSQNHVPAFILRTIYEGIIFVFIFPFLAFKHVMILHSIRYVCVELNKRNALRIRPLSPDKAGGLGALGAFCLKMVFVILPMMIPLVLYPIFGELNELFSAGIILYIPALIFAFLYPLSGAHNAMTKFKRQELSALSREFNRVYDEFVRDIRDRQLKDIPDDFELMGKMDQLYQKADSMPVWPFNLEILSKLGSVLVFVAIPILFEFISSIMQILSG